MTRFGLLQHVSGLKQESRLGPNTERDCFKKRAIANIEKEKAQKLIPHAAVVVEAMHCEMPLA